MSGGPIEFFWDPASPYTYLASTQIDALVNACGRELVYKPFLLGAVFQATGNKPPGMLPAKGRYMMSDLQQWAAFYGVPLSAPASFPVRSVLALRGGLVAEALGHGPAFARAVMHAHWGQGRDIADPAVVSDVAREVGLDPDTVLDGDTRADIKDALKANTEHAIGRGAFGAPTFFVGDAMFWGNDRLDLLRAHCQRTAA